MRQVRRNVIAITVLASIPFLLLYYLAFLSTEYSNATNGVADAYTTNTNNERFKGFKEDLRVSNAWQPEVKAKCNADGDCVQAPSCQVIHICIVCAGYNAARELSTVIKSIIFYRTNVLHLHLLVDNVSLPILNSLLSTWSIPSFYFSFYTTSDIQRQVEWIPNAHYSGVYGLMKLQIPYVLPDSVEKVILLDTDVILLDDIAKLWSKFASFIDGQYISLVENLSDWYLSNATSSWPALGRGFNTGVMLMNVKLMRSHDWGSLWRNTAQTYLPVAGVTKLADQDIINAVIKDNPHIICRLPCTWNVQVTIRATFEPQCYYVKDAQAVHFNSPDKYHVYYGVAHKDYVSDYFKNLFYMFVQYDGNLLKHKSKMKACSQLDDSNSTTIKPTISSLLESSPEVFAACYQVEGIRQSSQGRLHIYYLPYNHQPQTGEITLVAQFSMDRLGVLEILAENWSGPMSLCLYLSDSEAQQFHDFVLSSAVLSSRRNIGYHIVFKTGLHYPVNHLRNIALDHAQSDYVFLTDIDFLPMNGLYDYLKDAALKHDIKAQKVALIVPAFETQQYRPEMPHDKDDLKKFLVNNLIQIFRYDVWPEGHAATDYNRWLNATEAYPVFWRPNYEPYIVISKSDVPKYDERFFGFGWNKVAHIMEVDAQGFKMLVLPNAFIVHAPHSPSLDISQYRSSPMYRKCLQTLKKEFQKDLSRKYGIRALKYLSND